MKNVLLVDDDKIFNFLNSKTLEQTGLASQVHTALNGQQAITLINEYFQGSRALPDVILLDLSMPVMDGFEFIEAFRRLTLPGIDHTKIIIVSSSEDPRDQNMARSMGIRWFLTKPIQLEMLKQALADAEA